MGLKSSDVVGLQTVTIQRVDGEGFKEREPLAKIFGDCSALELFMNEFAWVPTVNTGFNTSTGFQLADVELTRRVTSLVLNSNSFELILRNLKRKLVDTLPATLRSLRLEVDRVEASDLAALMKNCHQFEDLHLTVAMIFNSRGQNWIPDSVKTLRLHDRSRSPVPRASPNLIVNDSVEELVIVAASVFTLFNLRFTNIKSLILLDSILDKQLTSGGMCETHLSASLHQALSMSNEIKQMEYAYPMQHSVEYLSANVLASLERLRYSWYYSTDIKQHIMQSLKACPNLKVLRTKYEPEIDALAFPTLLWLFVSSTTDLRDLVLNTHLLPYSSVFSWCTKSTTLAYALDRRVFRSQFERVRLERLDKSVHS